MKNQKTFALLVIVLLLAVVILFRCSSNETFRIVRPVTAQNAGSSINLFNGAMKFKNILIENPPEFKERVFVSLPEVSVELDTATLKGLSSKHLRSLKVNIDRIMVIRAKNGHYNFESLVDKKQKPSPPTRILIDKFTLKIGTLTFLDYTVRGDKPLLVRLDLKMDQAFDDIKDSDDLAKRVTGPLLKTVSIGAIKNFELKALPDIARSVLDAIPEPAKDKLFGPGKDRKKVLKELGERLSNTLKGEK